MQRFCLMILIIISGIKTQAQTNLVPNGDFEENTGCPTLSLTGLLYWLSCGSSDFFHYCSIPTTLAVPLNNFGYQFPYSGNAYVGVGLFQPSTDYREYIKVQLNKKLVKNCIYYIKFYYSNADKSSHISNSIGVLFDTTGNNCSSANYSRIEKFPQVQFPYYVPVDTNTQDWLLFEAVFICKENYSWMYIGNFNDNEHTNLVEYGNILYQRAYIYIDNVQLYNLCEDTNVVDWQKVKPQLPSGITVNRDGINDRLKVMNASFFNSFKLNLYDRWGHLLFSTNDVNFQWDGTFQGTKVPIGVYQWQAEYTTINFPFTQYSTGNVTVLY
jgi:gliding motility-associated-like protein